MHIRGFLVSFELILVFTCDANIILASRDWFSGKLERLDGHYE